MSKKMDAFLDGVETAVTFWGISKIWTHFKKKNEERERAQNAFKIVKAKLLKPANQATVIKKPKNAKKSVNQSSIILPVIPLLTSSNSAPKMLPKETPTNEINSNPAFRHSSDFYTVNHKGNEYAFSPNQARIVQKLYEAHENNTPSIHQSTLLVGLDICSKRMRDVFKNSPAFGTLIVPGKVKGTYRLNLPPSTVSLSH